MKAFHFSLLVVLATASLIGHAQEKAAPEKAVKKAPVKAPAKAVAPDPADGRVKAMQELMNASRKFANPSPEAKAWFDKLRAQRAESKDTEEQNALDAALLLDPAVPPFSPLGKDPIKNYPVPVVESTLGKLAATERSLDLGQKATALSLAELTDLATKSPEFETAQRALRLLRRQDPAAAAPLLWSLLSGLSSRSQVKLVEDELMRLPIDQVGKGFQPFSAYEKASLAAKAAWMRVVAIRPTLKADKAMLFPLLKGPANELTEAAWDAVPTVCKAADRTEVEAAAKGLSERLAPRAKAALALLK